MSHGLAVLAAARAAKAGADLEAAAASAQEVARRAHLVGALDTMRYLAKSGRVPWIVHWAASALQIKPVLIARGGHVRSFGRPRTMKNALARLMRYLQARAGPPAKLHVAVAHYHARERAEELAAEVRQALNPAELIVTEFTPVMSVHAGPGFVGLAFYSEAAPEPHPARRRRSRILEHDVGALEGALGTLPGAVEQPSLVVLSGLPGVGKTRVASEIAQRFPAAVLESDRLRKVLFERPVYSQRESGRLFRAVHELLDRLLARGVSCILDATNLRERHRQPLYEIAERNGAGMVLVAVEAPENVARARLSSRTGTDVSDADESVYEQMSREAEPITRPHLVVDGTGDPAKEAERVLARMKAAVGSKT
jgi:predicted kinase